MNRSKLIPALIGLLALATGILGAAKPSAATPSAATPSARTLAAGSHTAEADDEPVLFPQRLDVQVLSSRPHDPSAFTQGLLFHEGELYESAGEFGKSNLRRVDPWTGEVLQRLDLDPEFFAEGLARVDQRLIQLTWKNGIAFEYDIKTFEILGELTYDTEGWGLCYDGQSLVMSDGSSTLYFRDPDTFELQRRIQVTQGNPLSGEAFARDHLNELECVGDEVYANIWYSDDIVRIDNASGQVTAVIDASGLLTASEAARDKVLNGIAWDPDAGDFLITGKWWPRLFEVRFVRQQILLPLGLADFRMPWK